MSQKWMREMVSTKSEEAVSANGIFGSYTAMLGIDAKDSNDWIEGDTCTNALGLGDRVLSIVSGITKDRFSPGVSIDKNCWRIAA